MDFREVLRKRHSVRAYRDQSVSDETLGDLLRLINSAPSAGNRQAYDIILVREPERRAALAQAAYGQTFIAEAPVVLVFVANPERNRDRYGERGEQLYAPQDAAIACTYAHLAAVELGLGSCWIGAFDDDGVSELVGVRPPQRVVAMLPVGVSAERQPPTGRRLLSKGLHAERWQQPCSTFDD